MDEEEHQRRMWEMREEQRQKRTESSHQPTTDQAFEVPYVSKVAPFKESLENDTRELEWLVGKKIEVGGRFCVRLVGRKLRIQTDSADGLLIADARTTSHEVQRLLATEQGEHKQLLAVLVSGFTPLLGSKY